VLLVSEWHDQVDDRINFIMRVFQGHIRDAAGRCEAVLLVGAVLKGTTQVVDLDTLVTSDRDGLAVLERTNLIDQGISLDGMDGSTGNILLDVGYLPDVDFAVLSGASEDVVAIVCDGDCVDWVLVFIEGRDQCTLELMLNVAAWLALASLLISDFHSLDLIKVYIFEVRQN
jgi:hypothetical protein